MSQIFKKQGGGGLVEGVPANLKGKCTGLFNLCLKNRRHILEKTTRGVFLWVEHLSQTNGNKLLTGYRTSINICQEFSNYGLQKGCRTDEKLNTQLYLIYRCCFFLMPEMKAVLIGALKSQI